MSVKVWITIGILIGSTIGAYIPALWGDTSLFSISSLFFSFLGAIGGIWAGNFFYKNFID
jgi:uncharacterized membrane protein YeaQ/YmgE (transglycosylase-associated protein family)